jgi:hypothetical protein
VTAQIEAREPTMLERMGGVSGLVYASVPTFAYVTVNALAGLHAGVISSIAEAHPLTDQLHPDAATHQLIGERFAGMLRG